MTSRVTETPSAAERGRINERERGEESPAESNQSRKSEFPFPAERSDDPSPFLFRSSDNVQETLAALYEKQKNERRPQQRNNQPPVVLKQCQRIHDI